MATPMFQELDRVLEQVSKDRGIPKNRLIEAIESAFLSAARKKWGHLGELEAHYNLDTGEIELFQFKQVVEQVEDPNTQMTVAEAHQLDGEAQVGDSLGVKMDPSVFGRIAAQTAKQVIIQKMRDAERDIVYEEFKDRVGEIVTGIVRRFEKGDMIIDLGRTEATIPRSEQIAGEHYRAGERVQGYFMELNREGRGPQIVLSRKHPHLVRRLFEME
ncbi:MAG: transcription termination/antitermination protein NusA, partial [Deltaproteobacteria bacterium]|nr:transcription termination/antitermination protein NusA [Deltaproteobacteria bacterium]